MFRDGEELRRRQPPNNWQSHFGGGLDRNRRARTASGTCTSSTQQPDLNWENPEVAGGDPAVLRFWLDRGVDGFRVDVAHGMVKDFGGLPASDASPPARRPCRGCNRLPFFDQDGVHDIYRTGTGCSTNTDADRIAVAEAGSRRPATARYVRPDEMQPGLQLRLPDADWRCRPRSRPSIDGPSQADGSVGATTTWVLSNHDVVRHATRFGCPERRAAPGRHLASATRCPTRALGLRRARAATLLALALPGSAYLYQGEELGLPEHRRAGRSPAGPDVFPDQRREKAAATDAGSRCRGSPENRVRVRASTATAPAVLPGCRNPRPSGILPRIGRTASKARRWSCTGPPWLCDGGGASAAARCRWIETESRVLHAENSGTHVVINFGDQHHPVARTRAGTAHERAGGGGGRPTRPRPIGLVRHVANSAP